MAQRSKSAKKRIKTSKKRRTRNLAAKEAVKKAFKAAERAIARKAADVKELITKAISAIDKAAGRGIIHQNKAARKKSRLQLKYNKPKG
jgi:small subunit ribosomal protein S20